MFFNKANLRRQSRQGAATGTSQGSSGQRHARRRQKSSSTNFVLSHFQFLLMAAPWPILALLCYVKEGPFSRRVPTRLIRKWEPIYSKHQKVLPPPRSVAKRGAGTPTVGCTEGGDAAETLTFPSAARPASRRRHDCPRRSRAPPQCQWASTLAPGSDIGAAPSLCDWPV